MIETCRQSLLNPAIHRIARCTASLLDASGPLCMLFSGERVSSPGLIRVSANSSYLQHGHLAGHNRPVPLPLKTILGIRDLAFLKGFNLCFIGRQSVFPTARPTG